jgi:hypothetical protein
VTQHGITAQAEGAGAGGQRRQDLDLPAIGAFI